MRIHQDDSESSGLFIDKQSLSGKKMRKWPAGDTLCNNWDIKQE